MIKYFSTASTFTAGLFIYWLAGGEFLRGAPLAFTVAASITAATLVFGLWADRKPRNRYNP